MTQSSLSMKWLVSGGKVGSGNDVGVGVGPIGSGFGDGVAVGEVVGMGVVVGT